MSTPKKGVAYDTSVGLIDTANAGKFIVNPTLATGDFKVSTDYSAFTDLATLPIVDPAGSDNVKISLSASEMNGEKIVVNCKDVAGNEWSDVKVVIDATDVNVEDIVRSTTPANTLDVTAAGETNVGEWLGTTVATPTVPGVPEIDLTHMGGAAQSATDLKDFADAGYDPATNKVQGVVLVDTNNDMRGTDGVDTATMRGTDGANTVVPDAAGTAPTAIQNRQEMDSNSVDLDAIQSNQTTINSNVLLIDTAAMRGTDGVDTAAMRGTDGANTVVPDAAGTAPTAIQNRQEMDSNSTQLASIKTDTGTNLPGLIDDLAIKKNTAFPNFEFLMVLSSDHATPATGLTVTAQRSIDGAAFTGVGGAIAEVSNGIYQFDALAADTNGDVITWRFLAATADDSFVTFKTVA